MSGKKARKRKLFKAIYRGDGRRVRALLDRGVSANARSTEGSTALYTAAVQGEAWAVGELLAAGASPNAVPPGDEDGTPLCGAASFGHHHVLRALLLAGADPNKREADGFTPLLWAVSGGWYDCAVELLSAGADPDLADDTGRTPLHAAARQGRLQLVRLLLEHGADADLVDATGHTAWAIADARVGIDLEAELRDDLLEHAPPGSVAECRRTITVEVRDADGRRASSTLECSHPEIAALLSSS